MEPVTQIHRDQKPRKKEKKGHLPSLLLLVNPSPETQSKKWFHLGWEMVGGALL
jgi:hypothetical protein